MKQGKDDSILSGKESENDGVVIEKPKSKGGDGEDMMVDVVGADVAVDAGCNVDLSLKVGVNGARDPVMEEASDDLVESEVVKLEKDEVSVTVISGNKPDIVEPVIESVEEGGKELKITEMVSTPGDHGLPEGVEDKAEEGVKNEDMVKEVTEEDNVNLSSENMESQAGVEQTSNESLQAKIELAADNCRMAVESLFTEPDVQEVTDLDEKNGKDEVQDFSQKISVVDEGLLGKDETKVGPFTDNSSLSSDVVNAGTGEADLVNENAANLDQKVEVVDDNKEESLKSTKEVRADENLDQKVEVVNNSKEESSQSTMEVRADENLDQKDEVGKEESSKSAIKSNADDTIKSGEGNEVGDSKTDNETRSGDTETADEEVNAIDKPEEPQTIEIVEQQQPTDSVIVTSDGDHVMDEKSGKETEVLDLSIITESSAVASLELEEVDVVVVEEKGLEAKDEAQDGVAVEPSTVVNAGTGEDAVQVTESADQKTEAETANKDESLIATIEVSEVKTVSVAVGNESELSTDKMEIDREAACTEPELSVVKMEIDMEAACTESEVLIDKMEIDREASKVEPLATGDATNIQENQGSIIGNLSNEQTLTTAPDIEVPTTGEPQVNAELGVLPADSEFAYEAHMGRGEEAGVDIDEVLGWKDEIKVDPMTLSLETEQWNATSPSLQQSCYFQPPEKEGEFSVSDLVWGKVRSHPWWPGQIFDPSDSSEDAMKYHKKDCFLVAYFGDRTFAWNEATVLKPFRSQFSEVEKHENSEDFSNAIRCALEEVSRRVELGLTCSCFPQNFYENIKYQIVENSGISAESSKRCVIDKSAHVSSFEPHKLVDYMRLLAKFPYAECDKLELTLTKAQLSSYSRFKEYRQLAEFQICGDLLEENETYSEDGSKKRKALDSISDSLEKKPTLHTEKPAFKVGACIQRVATQLTGPPLADHVAGNDVSMQSPGTIRLGNQAFEGELLSHLEQLHLAAQNPMKGYGFLNTIIPFFNNHRSAVLSKFKQLANDARKRKASNENDPEEFEFDDVNDSYWTDRIIQNYPDENMLQENQNGGLEQHHQQHHQLVSYEQQHQLQQQQQQPVKQTRRSNKKRFFSSNHEIEAKEQSELIERRRQNLATEVLMKYPEGIYFPPEIHLNKMFRRFGPLMESETEVDRQSGRARVVFKKCSDAEVAHSSAGKFNIFGSINVNYELNYVPLISYKPSLLPFGQDPSC